MMFSDWLSLAYWKCRLTRRMDHQSVKRRRCGYDRNGCSRLGKTQENYSGKC